MRGRWMQGGESSGRHNIPFRNWQFWVPRFILVGLIVAIREGNDLCLDQSLHVCFVIRSHCCVILPFCSY